MPVSSRQLALRIVELAQSKKAEDITLMDLREVTNFADFFVLCTAHSDSQMRAIADAILEGMSAAKHKVWHAEGYEVRSWILLDYVQVVVHIFLPETRSYYALEKLWGDAPMESFGD